MVWNGRRRGLLGLLEMSLPYQVEHRNHHGLMHIDHVQTLWGARRAIRNHRLKQKSMVVYEEDA